MQEVFEKIIEKLEERTSFLSDCTKYGNKDAEQQNKSYSTMMMYEVSDLVDDLIEIVKQESEKFGRDTNVGSNGWIPCGSGVMPRANGWYLVTNHLGVVQEQRWSANHWEKLRDEAVLAWRELPLPYQPNGE